MHDASARCSVLNLLTKPTSPWYPPKWRTGDQCGIAGGSGGAKASKSPLACIGTLPSKVSTEVIGQIYYSGIVMSSGDKTAQSASCPIAIYLFFPDSVDNQVLASVQRRSAVSRSSIFDCGYLSDVRAGMVGIR